MEISNIEEEIEREINGNIAMDIYKNNTCSRCLLLDHCLTFSRPSETHLVALFGDGAAAIIVGADPDTSVERPVFQLVSAAQTILPDSGDAIKLALREAGLTFHQEKHVPDIISENIEKCLVEAFTYTYRH
ncbi:hypothetical protein K1719_007289 [Acacia pycnantha]|nr:hypothetical protein K1719_007289 [Acacia pycnantha]